MLCLWRAAAVNASTGQSRSGVLNMVDLAGSERLSKSLAGDDAKTLKETQSINTSLSVFGQVFSALLSKSAHVPFRSSKLTHMLQVKRCCCGTNCSCHQLLSSCLCRAR